MKRLSIIAAVIALLGCGQPESQQVPTEAPLPAVEDLAETETISVARGVLVEEVPEATAIAEAGIQPGDLLLAWKRLPNPPANPEPAEGALDSPFDFHDLRIEQAPRGAVEISGEHEGSEKMWRIEPGSWRGVEVRPGWIGDHLEFYRQGQQQMEGGNLEEGARVWQELSDRLGQEGEDRQRLWMLFQLARFWLDAGRGQAQAEEESERILQLLELPSVYRLESAWVQEALGDVFKSHGELDEADVFYSRAQKLRQRLDPQSLRVAYSLNSRGILAWNNGDLEKAQRLYVHALRIREQLAPQSLYVAGSLNNLGIVANDRGALELAQEFHTRALRIFEQLAPGSPLEAASLNNLGVLAWKLGDLEQAHGLFSRTLQIRKRLAPESLAVAESLNNLGNVASDRGDLEQAHELHSRSLKIRERLAPESLQAAASLGNLGIVASYRGDLEQAHELFSRALKIKEQLAPESLNVATTLNNLGSVAWKRGDLERAHEFHSRALKIKKQLAPESLNVADSLDNLGVVAFNRGDLKLAQAFYTRALQIRERLAPEGLAVATSLNNLGSLAWKRGDPEPAHKFHTGALQIRKQHVPGSLDLAVSLYNLGLLAFDRGDLEEAQGSFGRALKLYQLLSPQDLETARTLNVLANVMQAQGDSEGAASLHLQALEILEQQISNLGGSYTVQANFRAQQRELYREALELLLTQEHWAEAFHVLERFRARTFLTMLAERDIAFLADLPEELDRERRRFRVRYDRTLKKLSGLSTTEDGEEVAAIRQELDAMERERGEIEEQIRRASPRLAALQYPQPLTAEAAQEALDPGTLLLSYVVGEESTQIFALSREGNLEVRTSPVGEERLREQIERMRKLIDNDPSTRLGRSRARPLPQVSRELFDLLLAPLAERIEQSERLVILPDGPLHALPFAALIRENGGADGKDQYLVEWKPFHLALSMTTYAELKKDRPSAREPGATSVQLAAFGDPSYPQSFTLPDAEARAAAVPPEAVLRSVAGRDLGFDWFPLPFTRHEVEGIAELFPKGQAQTFLGPEALEERVKTLDSGIRILHLAAHAFTDDHLPLSSFVALTIPEDLPEGRDNGLLQAWEILEQVRIKADLVVLSGCLTGLGQELRGEGLIGLTRAFHYAGARSLMSTLWSVKDQVTAELMIRFYRHLRSGLPKDEALRAAQLQMLREPITSVDEKGEPVELAHASHPASWAGVQLYGDWQ